MKRLLFFVLFCTFFLMMPVAAKRLTQGFHLSKMEIPIPFPAGVVATSPSLEVLQLLSGPYTYLAKGAQCYVFENREGTHVIKLFRYDQLNQNPLRSFFRDHFKKKKVKTPFSEKVAILFRACQMAYERAREETGLIYVHLIPSNDLPILKLRGPLGQRFKIPLGHYQFVIQRKVDSFRDALESAIASGDPDRVAKKIDSFLNLLTSRIEKGIANTDSNLSRNFGYCGDIAVEIDFGNYSPSGTPFAESEEVSRYVSKFRRWLQEEGPEWTAYLDEQVALRRQK